MPEDEFKPKSSWVIGRSEDCDLVVQESAVSSRHCRLTHKADGFTVEDLNSTNGTFVNGARIEAGQPAVLHPPIRMGG